MGTSTAGFRGQTGEELITSNTGEPAHVPTHRVFGTSGAMRFFANRTFEREGAFFRPHLRPGMRVLDVGCGPGTITVGIAAVVDPGEVVGIDRDPRTLEQSRALAAECGALNARFEQADLYELPFEDASFDAAFAHATLEHVPDPVAAVRAMVRMVRPGGLIGIRTPDITAPVLYPPDSVLLASLDMYARFRDRSGGHSDVGRRLGNILRTAGLQDVTMGMSMEISATPERARAWADVWTVFFGNPTLADQVVSFGLVDRDELERMTAAWHAWAEHPDALYASPWGEAIGRVA